MRARLRPDETYNYGHRLRTISAWIPWRPAPSGLRKTPRTANLTSPCGTTPGTWRQVEGRPCLVSLYFRKFEGKLTLSATFRTHNAMDA